MREDLRAVLAIKRQHFRHRPTNGQRAADNRAGAGPGDQVEAASQIEGRFAPNSRELISQACEKRGRIDAPHSSAIQTEYSIWPLSTQILLTFHHLPDVSSLTIRSPERF